METRDDLVEGYGVGEAIAGMIASPVATLREMSRGPFLRASLTVYCMVLFVTSVSTALTDPASSAALGGPVALVVVTIIFGLILLFVQSGLCFGAARMLGAQVSFISILSMFALVNVPSLFMAPLALFRFMPGVVGSILYGLGILALVVWVLILAIIGIRETCQVATGRALLIYFLPLVLFVVLGAVLIFIISLVIAAP